MKTLGLSILSRIFRFFNRKISAIIAFIILSLPLGLWLFVNWLIQPESGWEKGVIWGIIGFFFLIIQCGWGMIIAIQWNIAFPKFEDQFRPVSSRKR